MRNFKRFLAMALTMLMVIGCVSLSAFAFEDYADGDYTAAVENLADKGIIYGVSETEFDPDSPVLRWQAALFLARMASGLTSAQDQAKIWYTETNTTDFTDVEPHQYIGAIQYAANFNFIVGNGDGTYNPDGQIIFQDMLTMAVRALGYDVDLITGEPFGSAGYPWKYISTAVKLGLDKGLEDVAYTAPLTRAQTAQLINNLFYTKSLTGHSYAIEVFGDYSQEELNTEYIVVASENARFPGYDLAGKGKVTLWDGTSTVTVDAETIGDSFVIGDLFKAHVEDDEIMHIYKASTSALKKLMLVKSDKPEDANKVVIGGVTYRAVDEPEKGGIVLYYKDGDAMRLVANVYGPGSANVGLYIGAGDHYVRTFDDDGDGEYDRGYVYNVLSGSIIVYDLTSDDYKDFDRGDGSSLCSSAPGEGMPGLVYVRNFIEYNTMNAQEGIKDGINLTSFYDYIYENVYCLSLNDGTTETVTGVLTDINLVNHTLKVNGTVYTIGNDNSKYSAYKYAAVVAACNINESLLNRNVRLTINVAEKCVVKVETISSDGNLIAVLKVEKDEKTGKITAKVESYKGLLTGEIEIAAVDGVYGALPAEGTLYAAHKDFSGKWVLDSDSTHFGSVSTNAAFRMYNPVAINFSDIGMMTSTDGVDIYGWSDPDHTGTGLRFNSYGTYFADTETKFVIWNGTEFVSFQGQPTGSINFFGGDDCYILFEATKKPATLDQDQYDDEDGNVNVATYCFIWNAEAVGNYIGTDGKTHSISTADYSDVIFVQTATTLTSITSDPETVAKLNEVLDAKYTKAYNYTKAYSVVNKEFVNVSSALDNLEVGKFYYVNDDVITGECAVGIGCDIVPAFEISTSHKTSYYGAIDLNDTLHVYDVDGYLNVNFIMDNTILLDEKGNLYSEHKCIVPYPYNNGDAVNDPALLANAQLRTAVYLYTGLLTAEPVVVYRTNTYTLPGTLNLSGWVDLHVNPETNSQTKGLWFVADDPALNPYGSLDGNAGFFKANDPGFSLRYFNFFYTGEDANLGTLNNSVTLYRTDNIEAFRQSGTPDYTFSGNHFIGFNNTVSMWELSTDSATVNGEALSGYTFFYVEDAIQHSALNGGEPTVTAYIGVVSANAVNTVDGEVYDSTERTAVVDFGGSIGEYKVILTAINGYDLSTLTTGTIYCGNSYEVQVTVAE